MYNFRHLFSKKNITFARKEELILVGVTMLLSVVAYSDIGVQLFYNATFEKYFSEIFQFFKDYSKLYIGDKRKPMLFFMGVIVLLPYFVYLLYRRVTIECNKVLSRPIDYSVLYLVVFPFLAYVFVRQVTEPLMDDKDRLVLKVMINFSLKSQFHTALMFSGYAATFCLMLVLPFKFIKCVFNKRR